MTVARIASGSVCSETSKDNDRRERAINAFCKALESTVRDKPASRGLAKGWEWRLDQFGRIRGAHPSSPYQLCPIEAVYWAKYGKLNGDVHQLAERIGLGIIAYQLVEAFDQRPHGALGLRVKQALGMM